MRGARPSSVSRLLPITDCEETEYHGLRGASVRVSLDLVYTTSYLLVCLGLIELLGKKYHKLSYRKLKVTLRSY